MPSAFDLWIRTHLLAFGLSLLAAVLVLLAGVLLAGIAARMLDHGFARAPRMQGKQLLARFLVRTVRVTILVIAGIVALGQIGVDILPLVAGIGVAGFIVGFAFKDSLSNFAAGLLLLLYQPFDQGDFVEIGGISGSVLAMSIVATDLRTPDGRLAVVPNSRIWNAPIVNFNKLGKRRIEWTIGVAYAADLGVAVDTLRDVLARDERVLADPAPHFVVNELGESSVGLVVRGWVQPSDFLGVTSDLRRAFKESLAARGIEIPFPQRVVHTV